MNRNGKRLFKYALLALGLAFVHMVASVYLVMQVFALREGGQPEATTVFIDFATGFPLVQLGLNPFVNAIVRGVVIAAGIAFVRSLLRKPTSLPGHCRACGYNLTGNVSGICPECGGRI